MNDKILAMYSGGLDSVYMLHLLLTDAQYSQYDIHVHHVNIHSHENRAKAESIAVEKTLKWFRENGYREFTDGTSEFTAIRGTSVMDVTITSDAAIDEIAKDPQIKLVAFGPTLDDIIEYNHPNHRKDYIQVAIEKFETAAAGTVTKLRPLKDIPKVDVRKALPEGLADKFWSCRTPKYVNELPQPCGKCKTCAQFITFGSKLTGF